MSKLSYVKQLHETGMSDVGVVGGKNASLGEMIRHLTELGVRVPGGFATTTDAFHLFLKEAGLDERIHDALEKLDIEDVPELARLGREIRSATEQAPLPDDVASAIRGAFESLEEVEGNTFAVRSSATAEDMPEASFAGQQESFLNVEGLDHVLVAIKKVFASLYNDRAIAYRVHQGFAHREVGISAGV